jgi:ubiquinone/menaquinone biosynthesis C-methylase UbiE
VLNLVPDKRAAFSEMFRVIKPGGHFCVSDVVYVGEMPESVRRSAELYVGCVAGAMERDAYLDALREVGFAEVRIVKEQATPLPDEVVREVLNPAEQEAVRASGSAMFSVTVYGIKR